MGFGKLPRRWGIGVRRIYSVQGMGTRVSNGFHMCGVRGICVAMCMSVTRGHGQVDAPYSDRWSNSTSRGGRTRVTARCSDEEATHAASEDAYHRAVEQRAQTGAGKGRPFSAAVRLQLPRAPCPCSGNTGQNNGYVHMQPRPRPLHNHRRKAQVGQ